MEVWNHPQSASTMDDEEDDEDMKLNLMVSVPINGRITNIVSFRYEQEQSKDLLLIVTEGKEYAILGYEGQKIVTLQSDILKEEYGTPCECGPIVFCIPKVGFFFHLYSSQLSFVPFFHAKRKKQPMQENKNSNNPKKILDRPIQLSLQEHKVLDIIPILNANATEGPIISILHRDARNFTHVTSYTLSPSQGKSSSSKHPLSSSMSSIQNSNGPYQFQKYSSLCRSRVDGGSGRLAHFPSNNKGGGILILGSSHISYLTSSNFQVIPMPQCFFLDYAYNKTHNVWILANDYGQLISLQNKNGKWHWNVLKKNQDDDDDDDEEEDEEDCGHLCTVQSMQWISDAFLFCGSTFGDSQLLFLEDEKYQILEKPFVNLGPIVDFDVRRTGTNSNGSHSLVTASGSGMDGTLRILRNGIGMEEYASIELPGIRGMWSIASPTQEEKDIYLIQSYVGETRVLGLSNQKDVMSGYDDEEEEAVLEEVSIAGLDSGRSTLYAGNATFENGTNSVLVQITELQVRVIDLTTGQMVSMWSPSLIGEKNMTVATANNYGQIVVGLNGGIIVYLQVIDDVNIQYQGQCQMKNEISCFNIDPFSSSRKSDVCAVGLWDDFTVRLLSLSPTPTTPLLSEILNIPLGGEEKVSSESTKQTTNKTRHSNQMARSLCMVTLDSSSTSPKTNKTLVSMTTKHVDMLLVGLGNGSLISYAVNLTPTKDWRFHSRKEVNLGTRGIQLIPITSTSSKSTCVLATGDRPTVIYLGGSATASSSEFQIPKLCYSHINMMETSTESNGKFNVNVGTSCRLFGTAGEEDSNRYSLCISDESTLRLGVIDDIKKIHVTSYPLYMSPRRIAHFDNCRIICVGCIDNNDTTTSNNKEPQSLGNCIRIFDDTTLKEYHQVTLEPFEMILSMNCIHLQVFDPTTSEKTGTAEGEEGMYRPFIVVGTAFTLPDEDLPSRGRILVYSCTRKEDDDVEPRQVTELLTKGGVYSICPFYNGAMLVSINAHTHLCQLHQNSIAEDICELQLAGKYHQGILLSLHVKSLVADTKNKSVARLRSNISQQQGKPQFAIVGDLVRSISLIQYYPEHKYIEEVARDFHSKYTTAIEMLTPTIYLGAESWNNIYTLKYNANAEEEEIKCRLDTIGEFHLGEMVNKFMPGSLNMTTTSASTGTTSNNNGTLMKISTADDSQSQESSHKFSNRLVLDTNAIQIGSQTLFGTVDGSIGTILGLDVSTFTFFAALQSSMAKIIQPVGNFSFEEFRSFEADNRHHPSRGFIDGDFIERFLELDGPTMESIVQDMNNNNYWWEQLQQQEKQDNEKMNDDDGKIITSDKTPTLSLNDVLVMVEEMTMLH